MSKEKISIWLMTVMMFCCMLLPGMTSAAAVTDNWYWISSDNNYSKFFAPSEVKVQESFDGVATKVEALTKTSYSFGGAKETLEAYGITDIKPNDLAYSLARIQIVPQTRTLTYLAESFYDSKGNLLWSKEFSPLKPKEINSQAFDEMFYAYIVDEVFKQGEVERAQAEDRWLVMWQESVADGGYVHCIADTTTFRRSGDNVIFWEWQDHKAPDGSIREVRLMKKAINMPQGTAKIINYQHWNAAEGWQDYTKKETDGNYYAILKNTQDDKELEELKTYELQHHDWVNRYSIAEVKPVGEQQPVEEQKAIGE